MALAGTAFLALWNDFDPARDEEYNCWHTFEHVPERVGIEGILTGQRRHLHPFFESAYSGGSFALGAGYTQHVSSYNVK